MMRMEYNTVENKRVEMLQGMESKLAEMETALQVVRDKFNQYEDVKAEGKDAVADMSVKIAELKEEIQSATDLTTAKGLMTQITELEQDVQLQENVNNVTADKLAQEIGEVAKAFYAVNAGARTVYSVLDGEYLQTTSMRSYDADLQQLELISRKINSAFKIVTDVLIETKIVKHGDIRFGSTHLGMRDAVTRLYVIRQDMNKIKHMMN